MKSWLSYMRVVGTTQGDTVRSRDTVGDTGRLFPAFEQFLRPHLSAGRIPNFGLETVLLAWSTRSPPRSSISLERLRLNKSIPTCLAFSIWFTVLGFAAVGWRTGVL